MTELVSYLTRQRAHTPQEKSDNKQKPKEVRVCSVMCIWLIYYWVTEWMNDRSIDSLIDNYVFAEVWLVQTAHSTSALSNGSESVNCLLGRSESKTKPLWFGSRDVSRAYHPCSPNVKLELRDETFLQLSSTIISAVKRAESTRESLLHLLVRAVFNWVSKVIWNCFGFT